MLAQPICIPRLKSFIFYLNSLKIKLLAKKYQIFEHWRLRPQTLNLPLMRISGTRLFSNMHFSTEGGTDNLSKVQRSYQPAKA